MTKSNTGHTTAPDTTDVDRKDPANEHTQIIAEKDDAASVTESSKAERRSVKGGLKSYLVIYWSHKKWSVPITVVVILLLVLAVPLTRYRVLSLFLKEAVTITVIDSTTNSPVSNALVQFGTVSAMTTASGKATLKLPVGNDAVAVYKKYYKSSTNTLFVSSTRSQDSFQIHLVATGRQVPVVITNVITSKPVANAEIKVMDAEAKTDATGKTIIVLPASAQDQSGTISASGYNTLTVKVQVTSQAVTANTFTLTPAGYVYFLSNLSGKVDVIKTNLDGSNRKTVLAGTGNETPGNTVLLASRDWKYLALYAQRTNIGNPQIDLIDTSNDTMSNIDEGNANFALVGWDGDRFIYQVDRNGVPSTQSGQEVLKSFDAPTKTITVLAQTAATFIDPDHFNQRFGTTYIVSGKVVYSLYWYANDVFTPEDKQQATLNSTNPDGSNNIVVKGFSTNPNFQGSELTFATAPYDGPNTIALQFSTPQYSIWPGVNHYFEYQNGQVTTPSDITDNTWDNNRYSTYLESPSGSQTFWSVPADGKNTLNVGDKAGNKANKVAILSDFNPYGWFTDNYLLVSKNGSELYIMPVSGGTPLRVTDYYKPSQYYQGYGGGYGGL